MTTTPEKPETPIVNITGRAIALGPLRRDLAPLYSRWLNDFEVARPLKSGPPTPTTTASEEHWVDQATRLDREVHFTIYELTTWRPIGNTGLRDIDYYNRTASFGILIGEKDCWDQGYGTEAVRLMARYAFDELGLHTVLLRTTSANERAIRAYEKAGFKELGRWREAARDGRVVADLVYMECLSTEFER